MTHFTRREVLLATATMALPRWAAAQRAGTSRYTLPGPYRSKVVEIRHPGSVVEGKIRQEAVRQMMTRGMVALTGATNEAAAWKQFFQPGDVVGVKGCSVGRPNSMAQLETLMEVFRGLQLAGVSPQNIVMYERYRQELEEAGYHKIIPQKAQTAYAVREYDGVQTNVEGYDSATFVEMPRVIPGADSKVAVNRRSHLAKVISKQVTKVVNVCCLKDHASAGITMALKNMSHGMTNNVSRSHSSAKDNWCDSFIPTVVGMPKIREKVVLHIGDGLIGTYDGGPGNWNAHFRTWEYRALFFATDPVAMDRIGWEILDKQRISVGLPRLAETGIKAKNPGHEQFDHRQPDHVLLAAQAGLGEADLKRIQHKILSL